MSRFKPSTSSVRARRFLPIMLGCLAMGFGWHATFALANPTAPTVVSGSASFQSSGNTLTVTNTPGAIINWQSFSIGAGATTRFVQQSAATTVLNRVREQDPTMILGVLSSNGKVFLIDPRGKSLTPSMRVDTAGLRVPQISSPSYVSVPSSQSVGPGNNVVPLGQGTLRQHPVSLNLAKREASF